MRWLPAWHALFYGFLVLCLSIVLLNPDQTGSTTQLILLAALLGSWYSLTMLSARRGKVRKWINEPPLFFVYLLVGWTVWFALTGYDLTFFLLLGSIVPHLFMFAPMRWGIVGMLILMGVLLYRLGAMQSDSTIWWMGLLIMSGVAGTMLAHFINDIIRQSTERKRLLDELESTRRSLAQAERQAGMLEERQRLAREIHDTLAQGFTSIVMNLEAAEGSQDTSVREHHLTQAKQMARASLAEARSFIWELRPVLLEQHPFERGLRQMLDQWATLHDIRAELVITGTRTALPSFTEHAILRIAQEALTNIRKHAQTGRVTVTLTYLPQSILLDVQDDGVGFNPQQAPRGYGLVGMRERAQALGGRLTIESSPGEGTTLVVDVPLDTPIEET